MLVKQYLEVYIYILIFSAGGCCCHIEHVVTDSQWVDRYFGICDLLPHYFLMY